MDKWGLDKWDLWLAVVLGVPLGVLIWVVVI